VHLIEDEQVANFLRGNELVFTTGIAHPRPTWLNSFTRGLIRNNAAGLVVNIGPYVDAVPQETVEYCKHVGFPLFTIPWHMRLVDITRDFCQRIIHSEQTAMGVSSAFKNAIFLAEEPGKYQSQLERHGFNITWRYCAAVLAACQFETGMKANNLEAIRIHTENIINLISDKYNVFVYNDQLIIILANFSDQEIANCIDRIVEHHQILGKNYKLGIGVGHNEKGLLSLAKSYKQASAVLPLTVKRDWNKAYYKDLGIYKLLLSVDDHGLLQETYDNILGKLADYDKIYGTDYMSTLKYYLDNDASVQTISKLTYVHRNTINYKLKKIKEITGCNIASVEDRLKMMLAFKIKEIL
jgi:DNA-binding PucR family transcriptional regulator